MDKGPLYCDVENLEQLPPLASGLRYFDFIGGSKELRCYIAPEDMPRNRFIEENPALFDETLHPVYRNAGIIVKQDASYALPGFYIVSHATQYRSVDEIDGLTSLRLFFILREIRKGMREKLGIEIVHVYYEERPVVSHNVHYWIVPIIGMGKNPRLYTLDIKKYLEQFRFSQNKEKIFRCNNLITEYIRDIHLLERDNNLMEVLSHVPESAPIFS
jgi:diadenosine tetraphosphate (Ap4A) HIT family hydrolase